MSDLTNWSDEEWDAFFAHNESSQGIADAEIEAWEDLLATDFSVDRMVVR